jgi:hypothetical protein
MTNYEKLDALDHWPDDKVLAELMVQEIKDAVGCGTKHYNASGKLLETPAEIVCCLLREGHVTFKPVM